MDCECLYHYHTSNIVHYVLSSFHYMYLVLFIMTTKNGAKISNLGANNLWIVIV